MTVGTMVAVPVVAILGRSSPEYSLVSIAIAATRPVRVSSTHVNHTTAVPDLAAEPVAVAVAAAVPLMGKIPARESNREYRSLTKVHQIWAAYPKTGLLPESQMRPRSARAELSMEG
jgi:hypothetical protein